MSYEEEDACKPSNISAQIYTHACVCLCVCVCINTNTHTHTLVGGSHQGRGERSEISAHGHGALVRNMLEMDKGSTAVDTTAADNLNDLNRNKDREKTQQVPSRVCALFFFW